MASDLARCNRVSADSSVVLIQDNKPLRRGCIGLQAKLASDAHL